MSRKCTLVHASLAACALSLALSSASWAAIHPSIGVHVPPSSLHGPLPTPPLRVPPMAHPRGDARFKHANGGFGNCRPIGHGRWIC